ncbi:hypothetical protein BDQ12DRAFT_287520 [Crucibulum laeve]|uniref:Uncharacterized protein n=1 Tax=Crucibulum laeve TaxID=68775 RepID=A0A5C3MBU7_9AGAR|nr:hypothetical protein BDQ12DRAFT_287520 [Crucibulum laeve]
MINILTRMSHSILLSYLSFFFHVHVETPLYINIICTSFFLLRIMPHTIASIWVSHIPLCQVPGKWFHRFGQIQKPVFPVVCVPMISSH